MSCYSRKEGCLDGLASNYDVTADDPCSSESCRCTYPQLTLNMSLMAGDSAYKFADTLINNLGQKYRIIDFRCYFSDFVLFQNNGSKIQTLNTISSPDNMVSLPDDVAIWKTETSFTPGTYKAYGKFDSLSFHIGLSNNLKNTTFSNLTTTHPLSQNIRLKGKDGNITDMTIRCIRLTGKQDTISLAIKLDTPVKIVNKKTIVTNPGSDIQYDLRADLMALLRTTDLRQQESAIETQIKSNISGSKFVR